MIHGRFSVATLCKPMSGSFSQLNCGCGRTGYLEWPLKRRRRSQAAAPTGVGGGSASKPRGPDIAQPVGPGLFSGVPDTGFADRREVPAIAYPPAANFAKPAASWLANARQDAARRPRRPSPTACSDPATSGQPSITARAHRGLMRASKVGKGTCADNRELLIGIARKSQDGDLPHFLPQPG